MAGQTWCADRCSQIYLMTLFSIDWTQLWLLIHEPECSITGVVVKLSATSKFHEIIFYRPQNVCAYAHGGSDMMLARTLLSTLLIDTVLGVVNAPEVVNTRKCVWQYGCWHEVIGDSQMSWNYFLQTPECVRICTWRVRHDVWYGCSQTCVMTLFSMDWTQLWLLIHQTVCRITGVGMKLSATPKFHETGPRMCAHMHMARQIWWRTLRPNLYNDTVLEVVAQLRL
jgi:hypothetical protein